jgi:hypothetical protein
MSEDSSNYDADTERRLTQENRVLQKRLNELRQTAHRSSPPSPLIRRKLWNLRQWVVVVMGATFTVLMVLFPPLVKIHQTGTSFGGMEFNTVTLGTHFGGYGYLFSQRKHEEVKEPPHGFLETRVAGKVLLIQLAVLWWIVVFVCRKLLLASARK